MTLDKLNRLSVAGATEWFSQICPARNWICQMVEHRPYPSTDELFEAATDHWHTLSPCDYREAFAARALISARDFTHVDDTSTQVLKELNHAYMKKHGFIFITRQADRSLDAIIAELSHRIENPTAQETAAAAEIEYAHMRQRLAFELTG